MKWGVKVVVIAFAAFLALIVLADILILRNEKTSEIKITKSKTTTVIEIEKTKLKIT